VIQLTLTLRMTTAQVFETSVTVNNSSSIQDYVHPDDQTQPTFQKILLIFSIFGQTHPPVSTSTPDKILRLTPAFLSGSLVVVTQAFLT